MPRKIITLCMKLRSQREVKDLGVSSHVCVLCYMTVLALKMALDADRL